MARIDNNAIGIQVARLALKLSTLAYQKAGEVGLEIVALIFRENQTIIYGVGGTAAPGIAGTGSGGRFFDTNIGQEGTFVTFGIGGGANLSGGFFIGGINSGWEALAGVYSQYELDIGFGAATALQGADHAYVDGNFNVHVIHNNVRGQYVSFGLGGGVAATLTYTYIFPDRN